MQLMPVQQSVTVALKLMQLLAPRIRKNKPVIQIQIHLVQLIATHCGTMVGRFHNKSKSGNKFDGIFRGCINCADKKAASFALGGSLKASKEWILLDCKLECCTGNNCNTQTPPLSQDTIHVFNPFAGVPGVTCHACLESNAATCNANQKSQTCSTDPDSLASSYCSSAMIRYRDKSGKVLDGFFRGCIDCFKKKTACYSLGGALKARYGWTLLKCEIWCCTDFNCNNDVPTLSQDSIDVFMPTAECHSCVESDAAACDKNQTTQYCDTSDYSLGTTHCASAVGKYRNQAGNVLDGFVRGCIDCADKKEACAAIGGNIKARKGWSLEKCDIECCTGNDCNTQVPTLSADTEIPVFLPPAAGASLQCYYCLESSGGVCTNQLTQVCKDDRNSLGTRHCYSATLTYRDKQMDIYSREAYVRGCIDCTDKKAACAAIGGFLKDRQKWDVQQCEVACCTGDKCNTQNPTLPYPGGGGTGKGSSTPTGEGPNTTTTAVSAAVVVSLYVPFHVRALAFLLAFGYILYHF